MAPVHCTGTVGVQLQPVVVRWMICLAFIQSSLHWGNRWWGYHIWSSETLSVITEKKKKTKLFFDSSCSVLLYSSQFAWRSQHKVGLPVDLQGGEGNSLGKSSVRLYWHLLVLTWLSLCNEFWPSDFAGKAIDISPLRCIIYHGFWPSDSAGRRYRYISSQVYYLSRIGISRYPRELSISLRKI